MCSILLVLTLCIIIFTLVSDYNRFCIGTFERHFPLEHHGFTNKATSRKTCSRPCPVELAPSQAWNTAFVSPTLATHPQSATKTSFQRSIFPCENLGRDEHRSSSTLEMFPLQAHLQWQTRTLCKVWSILEEDNGSKLCPSGESNHTQKSAMEPRAMAGAAHLGAIAMDQVPKTKAVTKAAIQKGSPGTIPKRQGQTQTGRRPGTVWTAIAAYAAIIGTSMDDCLIASAQNALRSCVFTGVRCQRREGPGEADAILSCCTQEAPGRVARRCPSLDEGRLHQGRSTGDKTTPCSGIATWQGQTGNSRCTSSKAEYACGLEKFLVTIGSTMDCLYQSVHGPGETTHGAITGSTRKFGHCQGEPQQLPISRWSHPQGGCNHAQRHGGHPGKGSRINCWRENRGQLPRSGQQFAGPPQSSCTSGAARSGPAGSQTTKSRLSKQQGKRQRCATQPRFWRG